MTTIPDIQDLGIIILKLQNCDAHSSILNSLRQFIANRPYNQTVIFNSYSELLDNNNIPILHLSRAKFFKGNIVVVDLAGLHIATKFINTTKIYFYATHVPWANSIKHQLYWRELFDQNIDIIAQNQQLYDIYEIMWKKPICIAETFDYETLKNFI